MKKLSSLGLAFSIFCSVLPMASASSSIPVTEPNDGFIQTANPEWTAAHADSASNVPGHREYHRNAEVTLLKWYADHAAEKGTAAYNRLRRVMVQLRNMMHRQFHMGMIQPPMSSSASSLSSRSSSVRSVSSGSRTSSSAISSRSSSSSSSRNSSSSSSNNSSSSSMSSSSSSKANQASVSLGAASTFAVLAGSTVTNTGMTTVKGDLGVSAGSAVTGFGPGVVTGGSIHAADTAASNAQLALTTAYNDLAGRSVAPVSVSGNLGGMTLSPGLYKSTNSLEISSGDLTLDAKGDANAIFIFQMASTLNVSVGRQVLLIGGAKASNVYWQVGTSATLESTSVFQGNILADQSIALHTGATVNGRLLARIGAVTLQGNTVMLPAN